MAVGAVIWRNASHLWQQGWLGMVMTKTKMWQKFSFCIQIVYSPSVSFGDRYKWCIINKSWNLFVFQKCIPRIDCMQCVGYLSKQNYLWNFNKAS